MSKSKSTFYSLFLDRPRLKVAIFTLFATCILATSLYFLSSSIGRPYLGISLSMYEQGWIVESVTSNGLANQAGIAEGEKPVEINGQSAEIFLEQYEENELVFGTSFRELSVISDSGQIKSVSLENSSVSWESVTEQITWLLRHLQETRKRCGCAAVYIRSVLRPYSQLKHGCRNGGSCGSSP
jgi:hypothetical protein